MQFDRNRVINSIYNQYIDGTSTVDDSEPNKYAWICGWIDKHNQDKRFEMLLKHIQNKDVVLDIGCGVGELVRYFNENEFDVVYHGIDINANYVEIAKQRYPNSVFTMSNGWNLPEGAYDWAVASGIFTVVTTKAYLLWFVAYVMEKLVKKGFAFNLLMDNPSFGLINYEPDEVQRWLAERFPEYKIEIVSGYLPDDFTVYVTK